MRLLKQSTAVDLPIGPFLDATDGVTIENGLTLTQADIRLKKNGAAWAQKNAAQTLSHEENGWYEVSLDATDTNTLGHLVLAVNESGALPVWHEFMVVPAHVYDGLVLGTDYLQVDAVQIEGGDATDALAAAASGGLVAADVAAALVAMNLGGTAQAGASGTITLASGASAVDDAYNGRIITIVAGTGAGQAPRLISDYVGSTKVATVTPNWVTQPDNTSVYLILH